MLKVDQLGVCINQKEIIQNISFEVSEHEILMVIGPNGAGKTTLIKAIMQNVKHSGAAYLNGENIEAISAKDIAKQIGVLTQTHSQQFSFTVYDVVSLGRYAHQTGMFSRMGKEDFEKIDDALKLTGTYSLKDRSVLTLSGGELQRIFLAAVFAQDPKLLILDEPTNHLDLQYQIGIFDTLKEWVKGEGRSVIAVVHDLNVVYTYGTKALLIHEGKVYAYGAVDEVLNRENLKEVYEVDVALWMQNLLKHWK
jgi:iron complex transport system ATP-binding protein